MNQKSKSQYDHSRKAVESFIQTVVYIDDREPGIDDSAKDLTKYDEMVSIFAEQNIICSMVNPKDFREKLVDSDAIMKIGISADVLVIDWDFGQDEGTQTKQFVSKMIKKSRESEPNQIRLILVYTQNTSLNEVFGSLHDEIKKTIGDSDIQPIEENNLVIQIGTCRIVVVGKDIDIEIPGRLSLEEKELPGKIVEEFVNLAPGLLSAAVFLGMSSIKRNAQKLLAKFPSEIDSAFITHLLLSEPTDQVVDQIISLIVLEIESILSDSLPNIQVNEEIIINWINAWTPGDHVKPIYCSDNKKLLIEIVKEKFQQTGIEELENKVNAFNNYLDKNTDMFHEKLDMNGNMIFSHLLSSKTFYESQVRTLTHGTIIKDIVSDKFFLCLQPRCDCVRLEYKTKFLFVELKDQEIVGIDRSKVEKSYKAEHIIVVSENQNEYNELYFIPKTELSEVIEFEPQPDEHEIKTVSDGFFYTDQSQVEKRYKWVDQLKTEHAQRLAGSFGGDIIEIGLTESEWSRRKVRRMKKVC